MSNAQKYIGAMLRPDYWPALSRGIVPTIEHAPALQHLAFSTILDVGANKGQFAYFARCQWPDAKLYCFEPLPQPRAQLKALLKDHAMVLPYALGNARGHAKIHVASRADSSSLLPLGREQKHIYDMEERGTQDVEVVRLDDVLADKTLRPALLKIDVQGFELEVLNGGQNTLSQCSAVYVEASFIQLYDGQPLADEVERMLADNGFTLTGHHNTSYDRSGRRIQADMLFTRLTEEQNTSGEHEQ